MGPLGARLPSRGSAGKAVSEMAGGEAAADAPTRSDRAQRTKHEAAAGERRVRDGEAARTPFAAAPQNNVEVEHARAPAAAAPAPEIALDRLETRQHLGRFRVAFDQRDGIGEIAARTAVRGIEDDRRGVEQPKLLVKPGDRRFDHMRRTAMAAVRPVRPDRDGVGVRCGQSERSFDTRLRQAQPLLRMSGTDKSAHAE